MCDCHNYIGCAIEDEDKLDCQPGNTHINAEVCEAEGCCWLRSDTSGVPWCFYAVGESRGI